VSFGGAGMWMGMGVYRGALISAKHQPFAAAATDL